MFSQTIFSSASKTFNLHVIVGTVLTLVTLYFYLPPFGPEDVPRQSDFLYQTWELEKVYRDGQRVLDQRNQGLLMTITPDSTAIETVRGQSFETFFYADSQLEYIYTGQRNKPEKYKIHALTPTLLKYGQHTSAARYEFVLKAVK
ncbi:MAG: hypothetical protein K0R51_618 [Cytophagaceae bacterium]|jgi:hypothetical protein|nr:hypothetical protein [Cytophagaceae bacterium]